MHIHIDAIYLVLVQKIQDKGNQTLNLGHTRGLVRKMRIYNVKEFIMVEGP